jgi:colanic acid/amylovoran biosynthesis protein
VQKLTTSVKNLARLVWRKSGLKQRYQSRKVDKLIAELDALKTTVRATPSKDSQRRILLVPPDPLLLTASRGDEAMLKCVLRHYGERFEGAYFGIVTASRRGDECALALGVQPILALYDGMTLSDSFHIAVNARPTDVVLVGADVLDGSYDPVFSTRLIALTDLLGRAGASAVVMGFSVSKHPHPKIGKVFEACNSVQRFNLRDPVSIGRFRTMCDAPAKLVADVAFLLEAVQGRRSAITRAWIDEQKAAGRVVLGVNIHPTLFEPTERHKSSKLVARLASALARAIDTFDASIVLVEHDFRDASSDRHCLDPLHRALREQHAARVHRPQEPLDAAELKGLAAMVDGILTGRMHLAIAALGVGTPIFGIDYKDKMEGLFQLFEIDAAMRTNAHEIIGSDCGEQKLLLFVQNLRPERERLRARHPGVREMALANFGSE